MFVEKSELKVRTHLKQLLNLSTDSEKKLSLPDGIGSLRNSSTSREKSSWIMKFLPFILHNELWICGLYLITPNILEADAVGYFAGENDGAK